MIKIVKGGGAITAATKERLLRLEIALVIDNTGSMGGEILQAQRGLADLAGQVVAHPLKPQARFAVIGYRDHPPQDTTYVSRTFCDLDSDLTRVHKALASMQASGGGDGPEAVADGVYDALNLKWNLSAQKAILLVGDSPPHGEGDFCDGFPKGCPCGLSLKQIAGQMVSLGVTGHAIGVRSDATMVRAFSEFAKSSGGVFVHLNKLSDLIPVLVRRIGDEMGKIEADLRTIEKIERGGAITPEDRESIERLGKKGIRVASPVSPPGHSPEPDAPAKPRIRILK